MDLPYQERATWPQLPPSLSALLPTLPPELLTPAYQRHQTPLSSLEGLWRLRWHLVPLRQREARGDLLPLARALESALSQVRDQRPTYRRQQAQAGVLAGVVLAVLNGATTVPGVLCWFRAQRVEHPSLLEALGVGRIPGNLSSLLRTLDWPAVEAALESWVQMWGTKPAQHPESCLLPEQSMERAYLVAV
jgi:hypothetical protein